jgi:hypothetical protein
MEINLNLNLNKEFNIKKYKKGNSIYKYYIKELDGRYFILFYFSTIFILHNAVLHSILHSILLFFFFEIVGIYQSC